MTPTNEDISRLKARENAIETLIDMHPNGAAYRAARSMSETLKSNLESRCNRIPDWALLDHAKSLSKYEILPDSNEVFADLLPSSSDGDEEDNDDENKQHPLKEGWEERVLRHHEKIIRAKNNASSSGNRLSTSSEGGSTTSPTTKPSNKTAVPPPRLISVLRQIFDSPSSGDLKGLLSTGSSISEEGENSESQQQQQVNVLPSLLHSVVNHPAFSSGSPTTTSHDEFSSSVKRHLADLFDSPLMKKEEGKAVEEMSEQKDSNTTPIVAEVEPPSAANLEAIIGNVCRDIYKSSRRGGGSSSDNSNIHGLLIASLSILAGSLNEEDFFANEEGQSPSTILEGKALKSADSSWNASPDSYLQVGGLLTLLKTTNGDKKFLVDKSLSRYFAEASSTYEERIEIQKAALQTTGTSKGDAFSTPKDYKSQLSGDSIDTVTPPPPLSSRVSGNDDEEEVIDLEDDGLPSDRLDSDELTNADVANLSRMLLSNIANIVGGDLNLEDVIDMGDDEEVDADEMEEEEEDADESEDDEEEAAAEEHEDGDEDENVDANSQATRDYQENSDGAAAEEAQSNSNQDEVEERGSNNEGRNEEDERMLLQRALALSLAATVSADGSDSSNSNNSEDRKISAVKSPSEQRNLKTEELKRKSSAGSMLTDSASESGGVKNTNLPPLPTPPSTDILPRSSWDDMFSESDAKTIFDPAVLTSFGNVPASHVLVQLLQTMLGIMEGNIELQSEKTVSPKSFTETPISSMKKSRGQLKDDGLSAASNVQDKRDFIPDSTTAQLLVASLHLSSYLRSSSIAALNEILSEKDEKEDIKDMSEEGEGKEETIQIADSAESEDPLEDDVLLVVASETALENKGFERKSAAAANISALRHTTKQKMFNIWTERASIYSRCCYLTMRCFRIFLAKCIQHSLRVTDIASSDSHAIYMSTKSRIEMSGILSSFHDASLPNTIQALQEAFFPFDQSAPLFDKLLVSSLRSESLLLWGASLPFLFPDYTARTQLVRGLMQDNLLEFDGNRFGLERIVSSREWSTRDLQCAKINIVCQRFSMSDMLDCLVPQPKLQVSDDLESPSSDALNATSSVVPLLGNYLAATKLPLPSVSRFYYALCSRSISSLLLWNDLALSPNERIGQDSPLQLDPNPSTFQFDPAKCADSIAIERNTANQRAVKVWGAVLSTTYFLPKTGIHRFAVKLDKCERGHIFIGVGTGRMNTKTYVGGDKNGWGFIGTQALWHNRNKIRGDYGAVLRTGAVVVATLDTDLGTLSYGLWKDGQDSETSAAVGPMSPSLLTMTSPRRDSGMSTGNSATIEDWGIAFEGLPLDAKIFPAVGLYQRDDRATLYTITCSTPVGKAAIPASITSGRVYYPHVDELSSGDLSKIRSWNQELCVRGITFAIDLLVSSIKYLSSGEDPQSSVVVSQILPRLAAAICLIPSCIPTLSAKYAMELLPFVTRCTKMIDKMILHENRRSSLNVEMKEGTWRIIISSDSDSKSSDKEYTVDIARRCVQDEIVDSCLYGNGKASKVSLTGVVQGTLIKCLEQCDDSKSVIDARLNLDGTKFDGAYHDVRQNSMCKISGALQSSPSYASAAKDATYSQLTSSLPENQKQHDLIRIESVLCLAASHLSMILCSPTVQFDIDTVEDISRNEMEDLKKEQSKADSILESSSILSAGKINDGVCIRSAIKRVQERCAVIDPNVYSGGSDIIKGWQDSIYRELLTAADAPLIDLSTKRKDIESRLEACIDIPVQSCGSFSRLCPEQYVKSCKSVAAAIMYHSEVDDDLELNGAELVAIFSTARQIMESGIRRALSCKQSNHKSRSTICRQYCLVVDSISDFMFELPVNRPSRAEKVTDQFVHIFNAIRSHDELSSLQQVMASRTEKSIMSYVGIRAVLLLLARDGTTSESIQLCPAAESAIISLHKMCSTHQEPLLSGVFSGCSSRLQRCTASAVQSIHGKIESMIESVTSTEDLVALSSLLLSLNTFVGRHQTMLSNCKRIAAYCRELAFQGIAESSTEKTLISSISVFSAQQILRATSAVLQSFVSTTSQHDLVNGVDVLQLIMDEMQQTAAIVENNYTDENARKGLKGISSDWCIYRNTPSMAADTASIVTTLTDGSPLMSGKNIISPPHGYLSQLMELLHCFVNNKTLAESTRASSTNVADGLFYILKSSLPNCIHLRALRLLRPVLSITEASSEIVEHLFEFAGGFSSYLESTRLSSVTMGSEDFVRVSEGAVATLRYLYASSPAWQQTIHDVIITSYSDASVCGVVSFLGGMPGCLQTGSFLIVEPDIASSLSSSSSLLASKTRSALGGNTSTMNNSAGRGVEGIVSGLCRQSAIAGILCHTDSKGMCELMAMPTRLGEQPDESSLLNTKVTVRAVRVSASEVASAAELPLCIKSEMFAHNITGVLMEQFNSCSPSIINSCESSKLGEETSTEKLPTVMSLLRSAMSIRSMTVLLSNPHAVQRCESLRDFLALVLQVASKQSTSSADSLSKLPEFEARIWHLLTVFSIIKCKKMKLESTPVVELEEILMDESSEKNDKHSATLPSSGVSGYRTPPPSSLASAFFGSSARTGSRTSSASTAAREEIGRDDEDDDESQNADAANMREAAIMQMTELGLPRQWAEFALRRTGDIESAVHFCLERGADMERLIAEDTNRGSSSSSRRRTANPRMNSSHLISQLVDMGFPRHWCVSALSATSNNVDEALTWILTNGDRLAAQGENEEDEKDEDSEDEEANGWDVEHEEADSDEASVGETNVMTSSPKEEALSESIPPPSGWRGSLCPIRFISGKSNINPETLEISGLKDGGFSSVGTKGVLLTSGKWYYEAEILTAGCLQIGWADSSFAGHCQADRGDGCGDGPSSWAFDGWRRYRWHSNATEWGCRWSEGDVVGCLVDMDAMTMSFTLNGKGEEIGMGLAFSGEGFRPCSGVYSCVSFNSREKLRIILGGEGTEPFKHKPEGYRGVGEAVLDAVKERQILLKEEMAVCGSHDEAMMLDKPSYVCDFSDSEHGHELFSWQHRFCGADASVHLGGNRSLRGVSSKKSLKSSTEDSGKQSDPAHLDIACRLKKIFEKSRAFESENDSQTEKGSIISLLKDAYAQILTDVQSELKNACISLNCVYAQKLVLHLVVAYSSKFTIDMFHTESNSEEIVCSQLYNVIDQTASISTWLGEAGAMAVSAEALGLGISTYDSNSDNPPGMCITSNGQVILAGGISQFLSSAVLLKNRGSNDEGTYTPWTFAAASEAAIGSASGGAVSFIRMGLQSALTSSKAFRQVLLAGVRRWIRMLAVTEFSTEDGAEDDGTDVASADSKSDANNSTEYSPDARLVCFMTGLLLSKPVQKKLPETETEALMCSLFEGWCVGLLSASAPWRMICATTAAGILNMCPSALIHVCSRIPVIAKYFERLESTVSRRVWAERAAAPVCSKFSQSMIELLASVKRAQRLCPNAPSVFYNCIRVDAATPLPLKSNPRNVDKTNNWEWDKGWIGSNEGWEVLTGTVEIMTPAEWKVPQRSIVRTLMDGGEGPPFVDVGCIVVRGLDWGSRSNAGCEDGQDLYEKDKLAKEMEIAEEEAAAKQEAEENNPANPADEGVNPADDPAIDDPVTDEALDSNTNSPEEDPDNPANEIERNINDNDTAKPKKPDKKKKPPKSKLPVGTVIAIEAWDGIPAMARRVRWHLTGEEGVYRFGADGGRFDIAHVDVNEKETRIKKRHPLPESMEQIAARYGFGQRRACNVILRLDQASKGNSRESEVECNGIMEWPDFGAGIQVECVLFSDGAISITEMQLLYGSKDSGWEARFGDPSYTPGTCTIISPIHDVDSLLPHEELLGSSSYLVKNLRNREQGGGRLRVTSEMRLFRTRKGKQDNAKETLKKEYASLYASPSQPHPISFDSDFHASSMSLSKDKRTVTCSSSEGRGIAFGNVGFTTGVHYWEVKIEKAEIGSVFIGVAEKPGVPSGSSQGSSFGFESKPRLNRWLGWGFVNFRATYSAGAERVYGSHCHSGDTVGVMLDCDSGRISYFYDGLKYGEHILNDLGCAFENVSPFGFNADGCGSGGAGQGAPSGVDSVRSSRYPSNGAVRPRSLWPVIGLRHPGDRVTMSSKWITSKGVDGVTAQENAMSVDEVVCAYKDQMPKMTVPNSISRNVSFPRWFVEESFSEYRKWQSGRWLRTSTRGSGPCKLSSNGLDIDLDTSPLLCAAACAALGLPVALLPGDKIDVKRSAGRILELQEEAVILGAYQGRLWYRLVSQKSEGGSLMEGGGRAWFWDESEAVEGGLKLIGEGKGRSIELPKINRFKPMMGGLKIVYVGGAVVRSDLEIFDGSANIGTIPHGTVIPASSVIERRLNSCGVVRFLIDHEPIGRGWISERIRGGKEEEIVEILPEVHAEDSESTPEVPCVCNTPEDSATIWYSAYLKSIENDPDFILHSKRKDFADSFHIDTVDEFGKLLEAGYINGMSSLESDSLIASTYGKISDILPHTDEIDCPFVDCAIVLTGASSGDHSEAVKDLIGSVDSIAHEVALESLMHVKHEKLPSVNALLARISMLRAFNRRARYALPWFSMRPAQEGSCVFGGLSGFSSCLERAGRTWDTKSNSTWVQVPSTSTRLRECKNILFPSIKRSLLDSIMDTTATPTPLSHDEYELPREVRTVRVNRLKARQAIASEDSTLIRKHSVFSQLQREMRGWSGATLRRGFVAKGHGGQKRAFKVKLVGEGVNDYSGPYREVFTDAMLEVVNVDKEGHSSLGVLEPTPNNEAELGEGRDLFMFSQHSGSSEAFVTNEYLDQLSNEEKEMLDSFSTVTCVSTEQSREVEEAIVFLGKLAGTACRHSIPVDLPLPLGVVWDRLVEEPFNPTKSLLEIDLLAYNRTKDDDYHDLAVSSANDTLSTQRRLLNFFAEGMSSVMPVELLTLFTGEQLRDILCGNPDIDIELLRRVVEYEGYNEEDQVISFLWDVLREMTTSERKLFLQFVWARNRLPLKEADFDAPFRIQKDTKCVKEGEDFPLPSASTCFFSLMLPEYPSKEMLKEKLLFAIENVTTMESDYVTNDVEVSEGWRGL